MKKLNSLILAVVLFALFAVVPFSVSAKDKSSYQTKKVTAYLFEKNKKETISCLFLDDLPNVPYISAEDYLSRVYTIDFTTTDHKDGTYTIKNENGEMFVDVNEDRVHFDDFESFAYYDSVDANTEESANYINWSDDLGRQGDCKAVDLDLYKYDLDLVGANGKAYFPLYTISDMFSDLYLSAIYRNDVIYFIRSQDDDPYYDDSEIYESTTREEKMIDFTYNELCFSIDHYYGMPPKAEIADEVKEKGFDTAIKEYNEYTAQAYTYLHSKNRVEFCKGLMLLDNYFSDGGHTMLCGGMISAMNTYSSSQFATELQEEIYSPTNGAMGMIASPIASISRDQATKTQISTAKDDAIKNCNKIKSWDDAQFYQEDKTGIFVFEEFKDAVVEPFKWSLDYAAKNDLENYVIDLSTNGGGAQAVVFYMLSLICGDSTLYETNTFTGNRFKESPKVDKNLDGKFDNDDNNVKYDLKFAIMTTRFSFSSANMLACCAKESGIAIIGEASGGGTCALAMRYLPDGSYYYMSSDMMITYENGNDLDAGAHPDTELNTSDSYENFFDFELIDDGIDRFYNNTTDSENTTEQSTTEPSTEKATESADGTEADLPDAMYESLDGRGLESDTMMLYLIFGVMAAILIAIVILIAYSVSSGKKKKQQQLQRLQQQRLQQQPYRQPQYQQPPFRQPTQQQPYQQPQPQYRQPQPQQYQQPPYRQQPQQQQPQQQPQQQQQQPQQQQYPPYPPYPPY